VTNRRDMRTAEQIEANRLDMEIFNLSNRMERFAAEWATGDDGFQIANDAETLRRSRTPVRRMMHRDDVEATK
jgi:hypothetical protein